MSVADSHLPVRIVLVDDDDLFRESVEQNLIDAGYETATFGDGRSALAWFTQGGEADLVLLDWKMPNMNGIEVLRALRTSHPDLPVIFLTVLSDQMFEEAALTGGAVDFVEKARSFTILQRRIELILGGARGHFGSSRKAGEEEPAGDIRVGLLELLVESHRAEWNGKRVDLTLTEFMMVHRLAARAGRDVSYRDLYDLVHGEGFMAGDGTDGFRANVRTFIKRIRQKFRSVDGRFEQIQNYPGFGYQWKPEPDRRP